MTITLYGIPNCDTIKKARKWLTDHGVDYEFHDYKKKGVDEARLRAWVKELGWEPVGLRLNRLQKRDSGLIFPDFSSHSSHYAPQNHEKSSSLSHFFATIPPSPTGSWETLLNRRGMMWRRLSDEVKAHIDEASAIQLMLETPSIIKRPVLDLGDRRVVGFKEADYETLFS